MSEQITIRYTCALCGETFTPAWTDEEARAEYVDTFGGADEDTAIVCDDCYKQIVPQHLTPAA